MQAIPLVAAAALGHALFGDLQLDIAAAVLVGSIPGVLLGARISSRAPAGLVRTALVIVLLASALKLLDVPNGWVGVVTGVAVVVAVVARTGRPTQAGRRAATVPAEPSKRSPPRLCPDRRGARATPARRASSCTSPGVDAVSPRSGRGHGPAAGGSGA